MSKRIHLIVKKHSETGERLGLKTLDENIHESGSWVVTEEVAKSLVGGDIYLHEKQQEPSYFGGKILDYRVEAEGENIGRVIFRFEYTREHKNFPAGSGGWGNEKKIV